MNKQILTPEQATFHHGAQAYARVCRGESAGWARVWAWLAQQPVAVLEKLRAVIERLGQ